MKKKKINKTNKIHLTKVLRQMTEWSLVCGGILNDHLIQSYRRPLKLLDKGKAGLATEADLLSESYVMGEIRRHYPGHRILSEEDAFTRQLKLEGVKKDEFLWLIDPLDGTNNFYNRVPFFAVSLALNQGHQTLVGLVYNPITQELFTAIRGKGAWLTRVVGGQRVKVKLKCRRKKKIFEEALLSANLPSKRVEKDLLKRFPEVRAMRRLGSAALEMSYVSAGMLDAYWEYKLMPWDMAAAGLICEEAGVKISSVKGAKYDCFAQSVLVSDPALYPALKRILNQGP